MAALALSVPLARITFAKTTMTIKGQRRSTASKHRRASDVSLSASRPIFSQPEHTTRPQTRSPTRILTLSPDVLASVPMPTPALIDAPDDPSRSEVPSEGSQPQRLLPEKLLHFYPSKDPRCVFLVWDVSVH
ncbi:hypothetical protein BS47DRAFT_1355479 [Hydnum rufescens UP504]|uniref:Uncharacterized protein n=1 Tax=Hydnum rufescens UP504 TaxID=1448309 RepID=A0A9P6AEE0_9AGAM|nr:hypothetical protein BS47DRAFT_1355479 [Hydnum rufescens UP504]